MSKTAADYSITFVRAKVDLAAQGANVDALNTHASAELLKFRSQGDRDPNQSEWNALNAAIDAAKNSLL